MIAGRIRHKRTGLLHLFYSRRRARGEAGSPVRALIAANRLRATLVGHVWLIEPAALDTVRSHWKASQQNECGSCSTASQAKHGSCSAAGAP
jgi:hypothetical protein